jgi:hypothetical protein
MQPLRKEDLQTLVDAESRVCVSLYMPTERAGKETLQNPARLKNLLRDARSQLATIGMPEREIEPLLKPASSLVGDYDFWQHQQDGLAMFASEKLFRTQKLPYLTSDRAVVARCFLLKPLLPLFAEDGWFYILSLSQNAVDFYRADRFDIEKLPLDHAPTSLDDFLRFDVVENNLQRHAAAPSGAGTPTSVVQGHGFNKEDVKIRVLHFFQQIDHGLQLHLRNEHAPLILAGVEANFPLYHEANTYRNLLPEGIRGAPESRTKDELRKKGWETVRRYYHKEREAAAASIEQGFTKNRATADLEKAVAAASQGCVDTCFAAMDEERWGMFHSSTAKIALLEKGHPDARDLVDLVGVRTLIHGGRVFPVQCQQVPGGGPVAALLRYGLVEDQPNRRNGSE